jgi:hypothetical protein
MSSSNSSEIEDQIAMACSDVMDEAMNILHQPDGRNLIYATSIVIVKQLILGCGTTTSTTIACTPHHTSARGIVCGGLFF